MRSNVNSLLPIRNATRVTALHAPAGQARRSNFHVRGVPALSLLLMVQENQRGRARMCFYLVRFAELHCSALKLTSQ